ncbi:MAG: MarR family transcriptional regulator [Bacteroidota bacterium]
MKIEDAIQQKRPFRNAYQKTIVNLIYTHNWVTDQLRQYLKPHGVTMKQYNVLRILKGADGPITTSVIRERLLDKMSDASRMVERMYKMGLVTRNVCTSDKRLVDVTLSEKGERLLEEMQSYMDAGDQIVAALSEEEAETLSALLDKLRG